MRTALSGVQHSLALAGGAGVSVRVRAFRDLVDPQARAWKFGAVLFSLFAGLALVIAAVGVYSAIATRLEERMVELGVRRAIGAGAREVAAFVAGKELLWALGGVALGVCIAAVLAPKVITVLVRVSPRDVSVIVTAIVLSVSAALAATAVPVARIMSREPSDLMRPK